MAKKQWRIENSVENGFILTRAGACFYFDIMTQNNFYWNFYHKQHFVGWLFKAENEIANPEEYEKKTRYKEV